MHLLTGSYGRQWGGPWYEGVKYVQAPYVLIPGLSQGPLGYVLQVDINNSLQHRSAHGLWL